MLAHARIEDLDPVPLQPLERPGLVALHEATVFGNVGRDDRGQSALHTSSIVRPVVLVNRATSQQPGAFSALSHGQAFGRPVPRSVGRAPRLPTPPYHRLLRACI